MWTPSTLRIEGRLKRFNEVPSGGWLYTFSAEAEMAEGVSPFIQTRRTIIDDGFATYSRTDLG